MISKLSLLARGRDSDSNSDADLRFQIKIVAFNVGQRQRFRLKCRFISQISKFSDSYSYSNFKIVQISKFQKIFDFPPGEVLNSDLGFFFSIFRV